MFDHLLRELKSLSNDFIRGYAPSVCGQVAERQSADLLISACLARYPYI
jgi:hypothetical protein